VEVVSPNPVPKEEKRSRVAWFSVEEKTASRFAAEGCSHWLVAVLNQLALLEVSHLEMQSSVVVSQ